MSDFCDPISVMSSAYLKLLIFFPSNLDSSLGFIQPDILHDVLCIYFPGGSDGKASACNAGNPGLIPGLGRSPEEGNGNPFQHSCLENPMDGGA